MHTKFIRCAVLSIVAVAFAFGFGCRKDSVALSSKTIPQDCTPHGKKNVTCFGEFRADPPAEQSALNSPVKLGSNPYAVNTSAPQDLTRPDLLIMICHSGYVSCKVLCWLVTGELRELTIHVTQAEANQFQEDLSRFGRLLHPYELDNSYNQIIGIDGFPVLSKWGRRSLMDATRSSFFKAVLKELRDPMPKGEQEQVLYWEGAAREDKRLIKKEREAREARERLKDQRRKKGDGVR